MLEITPVPTPDERAAIERALADLGTDDRSSQDAWWQQGLVDEWGLDGARENHTDPESRYSSSSKRSSRSQGAKPRRR